MTDIFNFLSDIPVRMLSKNHPSDEDGDWD